MQNNKYEQISKKLQSGFFGFRIKKRKFTFILVGIIVVGGLFSLISIPKESSPEIEFGMISITTVYQGATPQDIDGLITDKIEKEVKNIDGIKKITSTSNASISNVFLEFENDVDMTQALVDVKDSVDSISLPSDAQDPKVQDISANNEMMFSVLIYGDQNKYSPFYLKEKGRILKENLEGKNGINKIDFDGSMDMSIGSVSSNGDSFYNIEILLNKEKIEELGLNILQISQTIKNRNTNQPLGNHKIGELNYSFRIQGEIKNIQEIGQIPIQTQNGYIKLQDISKIQRTLKNNSFQKMGGYQLSGQNYINLFFNKQKGDNIFKTAKSAKKALKKEFQKGDYIGLSYIITLDLSDMINEDYDALAKNGLQTLILVFLALLIFVGFKESLIATITLPLAFFITFIVLKNLGLSLNFLTNFSFVITFGIAIDTTIVVIEGAHEKMRQGFKPINSILLAVKEYKTPLISGTATTICVFIPLLTLPGIMGKFLAYIPITIFSTLVAALLISLTINSALYYRLSKPRKYFNSDVGNTDYIKEEYKILLNEDKKGKIEKPEQEKSKREKILDNISTRYSEKLGQIIHEPKKRILSIVLPIGALILSFIIISPNLGFELFPANDNGFLTMNVEGAPGEDEDIMKSYHPKIEKILSSQKEIKTYYSTIKGNKIKTSIELIPQRERNKKNMKTSMEMETTLDEELSFLKKEGLKTSIKAEEDGPPSTQAIGIKLTTNNIDNLETLTKVALEFETYLNGLPGTKNVNISSEQSPGQFLYEFDKNKLTLLGLNPNNFTYEIFGILNGIDAGTLKGKHDDHDIKIYYENNKDSINPQDINNTNITTPKGKINFGSISKQYFQKSINSISRENNKILISISSDTKDGVKAETIQTKLQEYANNYNYPEGISFSMGGENQENMELIQAILIAFGVALLSIFAILVLQFNSYSQPVIILYSVLMGLLGGNIGLRITGQSYGLMFGIGFIALTGIIVNDAIVLLDRANNNIKKGMQKIDAIKEAGKARLQPIILTTLTTFLGLTSIVSDSMWKPLAITIMVGIIFGSAVTLFVIPSLYFDKEKLKHIFRRTIIRYGIYLTLPLFITIAVMFVLMILNINTSGLFVKLFLAIFIGFNIRYSFYTIHAWSTRGQTIIQKHLGLKFLNLDGSIMTEKQATKRFLIATCTTIGPIIIGIILMAILGKISKGLGTSLGVGILVILYLIIITKNLLSIRTHKDNLSLVDMRCKTKTIDENLK